MICLPHSPHFGLAQALCLGLAPWLAAEVPHLVRSLRQFIWMLSSVVFTRLVHSACLYCPQVETGVLKPKELS